jgi:methionyl-tRNA formyltransferase
MIRTAQKNYVIATIKPWNILEFKNMNQLIPGNWFFMHNVEELTLSNLKKINPRYVFFPHWSHKVPVDIIENYECICFHETDLPFGRGGSPLQNLIIRGIYNTNITALRMVEHYDAGPIYLKKPLSLYGSAEEIYIRAAKSIKQMIAEIIEGNLDSTPQSGEVTLFKRRQPEESFVPKELNDLDIFYDFIRMLDADGYPLAKINYGNFQIEFSNATLRSKQIDAFVKITKLEG